MAAAEMRIELIRSLGELERYAAAWDDLAFTDPRGLPTLSHAWVAAYLEHRVPQRQRWCCLVALEGDRLVGVLPVILERRRVLGFGRTLLRCPADLHTTLVEAVVVRGREGDFWHAVIGALDRVAPDWYALEVRRVLCSSPSIPALRKSRHVAIAVIQPIGDGRYLPTAGSFEAHLATLSKSFRKNLRKAQNRLEGLEGAATEFIEGEAASESQLARFMAVEVSNWKAREGGAIAQSEDLIAFYETLTRNLGKRGWLEWQFLSADGTTIAAYMAMRCGRSLVLWKTGYDEAYARLEPGSLLMARAMQRAFESDETDAIHVITDQPWMERWGMPARPYCRVGLYRRGALPIVACVLPQRARMALQGSPRLRALARRFRRVAGVTASAWSSCLT